jgi:predicted nucleic acid-binding Zn ribbon protein
MTFDQPRARRANPVAMDGLVDGLVDAMGMRQELFLDRLSRDWTAIVGAANARITRPVSIEDGVLTVAVGSPSWITQLKMQERVFRETVNAVAASPGTVRSVRFVPEGISHRGVKGER